MMFLSELRHLITLVVMVMDVMVGDWDAGRYRNIID